MGCGPVGVDTPACGAARRTQVEMVMFAATVSQCARAHRHTFVTTTGGVPDHVVCQKLHRVSDLTRSCGACGEPVCCRAVSACPGHRARLTGPGRSTRSALLLTSRAPSSNGRSGCATVLPALCQVFHHSRAERWHTGVPAGEAWPTKRRFVAQATQSDVSIISDYDGLIAGPRVAEGTGMVLLSCVPVLLAVGLFCGTLAIRPAKAR